MDVLRNMQQLQMAVTCNHPPTHVTVSNYRLTLLSILVWRPSHTKCTAAQQSYWAACYGSNWSQSI